MTGELPVYQIVALARWRGTERSTRCRFSVVLKEAVPIPTPFRLPTGANSVPPDVIWPTLAIQLIAVLAHDCRI